MNYMMAPRTSLLATGLFAALVTLFPPAPVLADSPQTDRPRTPERPPAARAASYFPLAVGYKWVYTSRGVTGGATRQVEVVSAKIGPHGHFVYELQGYFAGEPAWVAVSTSGEVTQVVDNQEYLWYELGAPVQSQWKMEAPLEETTCQNGVTLEIGARGGEITTPLGEFGHVVRVNTVIPVCMDGGIASESFAQGVGMIERTENTFAGPRVWELAYAELGATKLPAAGYSTSMLLSSSRYVNNQMPPLGPNSLPRVRGVFVVRNATTAPTELVFTGCRSLTLEVRNDKGELVLTTVSHDNGCCECDVTVTVDLTQESFALPFAFVLADGKGDPLPDGFYTITGILNTVSGEFLRPTVRSKIEVASLQ
jgi:hypothetical protein